MKIEAVHVHYVHGLGLQYASERFANGSVTYLACSFTEEATLCGNGNQSSRDLRTLFRNDDGPMAGGNQGTIDVPQNLFRAADRVPAHGRKRKGNAQHREAQS